MIRRLFKWTFRLLLLVLVTVTVLALGRNTFLRLLLERRLEAATGLETTVGRAHLDWLRPVVRFQHVRLFNPQSLGGKPFLDILELKVTYDFSDLFSRRLHVRELEAMVADVRLMRQEVGQSTQATLARHRAKSGATIGSVLVDPFEFTGVDRLVLSVDRYIYSDYVEIHRSQEVNVNIRDLSVRPLRTRADWQRLWEQLARARGILTPPLPSPPLHLPPSL